jgi:hypothetical protein
MGGLGGATYRPPPNLPPTEGGVVKKMTPVACASGVYFCGRLAIAVAVGGEAVFVFVVYFLGAFRFVGVARFLAAELLVVVHNILLLRLPGLECRGGVNIGGWV